jgi:hypothetical protein
MKKLNGTGNRKADFFAICRNNQTIKLFRLLTSPDLMYLCTLELFGLNCSNIQ